MLYFVQCERRHILDLASRGWLEVLPKERVVVSSLSDDLIQRWLRNHGKRATRQAAVMEMLIGQTGAVRAVELPSVPLNVIRKLDEKDLLRLSENPARVKLNLTLPQAQQIVVGLKKPDRRARVLDFLAAQAGGPLEISWIYEQTDSKFADLKTLAERGLIDLGEIEVIRDPMDAIDFVPDVTPELIDGQERVWKKIEAGFKPVSDLDF